jgi:hypothetical protein
LWRELSFCLHLISKAICPGYSLRDCLVNWGAISKGLEESPRERRRQIIDFCLS